jgi:hypothetical protein
MVGIDVDRLLGAARLIGAASPAFGALVEVIRPLLDDGASRQLDVALRDARRDSDDAHRAVQGLARP